MDNEQDGPEIPAPVSHSKASRSIPRTKRKFRVSPTVGSSSTGIRMPGAYPKSGHSRRRAFLNSSTAETSSEDIRMPGAYPKSDYSGRRAFSKSNRASTVPPHSSSRQVSASVHSTFTPSGQNLPASTAEKSRENEDVTPLAPAPEPCVPSAAVDKTKDASTGLVFTQGDLLVMRQEIHHLGQHLVKFTDALVSFTASHQPIQPEVKNEAPEDFSMDIDNEVEYDAIQTEIPPLRGLWICTRK
ncbi:hypothetical protein A0H81_02505 [Grifola frondosa]|uniref:Uncharacterized protein n=1 Tax=Grifola frondosa TaxID=5627 RepID=A0A1C7MML3_GRIFR|nr:hypothetical protein A0H81_02505 [Grifola frondosa]